MAINISTYIKHLNDAEKANMKMMNFATTTKDDLISGVRQAGAHESS